MKRQKPAVTAIIYIVLITGAVFCIFPFYWMVKTSMADSCRIFEMPPRLLPAGLQLDNYAVALTEFPFGRFFLNSLIVTILTMTGTLVTSSMCAYSFSRICWKGRNLVFRIILTALMLPFFVVMIPQFIGWHKLGLIDTFFPLVAPAWFGGGVFNIFLLRQFFLGIPREMDEAARIDGAGYFGIYSRIIVPMGKQAMIVVGLLSFIGSWNDYLAPMIFISSERKYTLMLGLNLFLGSYTAQWNYMMAATSIVVIPSLLLFIFAQRHFVDGIAITGTKV